MTLDPEVWIPALSLGGAVVLWVARLLWRVGRVAARFSADFYGAPARPGVPRRPGVMERLEQISASLAQLLESIQAQQEQQDLLAQRYVELERRVSVLERGGAPGGVSLLRK